MVLFKYHNRCCWNRHLWLGFFSWNVCTEWFQWQSSFFSGGNFCFPVYSTCWLVRSQMTIPIHTVKPKGSDSLTLDWEQGRAPTLPRTKGNSGGWFAVVRDNHNLIYSLPAVYTTTSVKQTTFGLRAYHNTTLNRFPCSCRESECGILS